MCGYGLWVAICDCAWVHDPIPAPKLYNGTNKSILPSPKREMGFSQKTQATNTCMCNMCIYGPTDDN